MVLCSFMLTCMRMLLYQLICISTAVWADLGCTQMHFTYWEREREREKGQEGDNEEWPQWSYESRRLLGMRKGAGSEGYNSQQGQSLMCVCVCLCNAYASMRESEWTSASLVMWACRRERTSFIHVPVSFPQNRVFQRSCGTEQCTMWLLCTALRLWSLTANLHNKHTHTHTAQTSKAFLSTGLLANLPQTSDLENKTASN